MRRPPRLTKSAYVMLVCSLFLHTSIVAYYITDLAANI